MEEVDGILIRVLRQNGSAIPDEVQSVREFSTELVVDSVVRCLRAIEPSLASGLSPLLPPGMSARFRLGTSLAQACQDLGYGAEIGYHTFLYSNEVELRRLLMFLVDKLPRDTADSAHQPAGKMVLLQQAICAQLRWQLSTPWLPVYLRTPALLQQQTCSWSQPFRARALSIPEGPVAGKQLPRELKEYWERYLLPVTAQPCPPSSFATSLLERAAVSVSAVQEWEAEWNSLGLVSRLSAEEYRARKAQRLQKRIQDHLYQSVHHSPGPRSTLPSPLCPDLPPGSGSRALPAKGSRFTRTERFTFTQEAKEMVQQMEATGSALSSSRGSEEEVREEQEQELSTLYHELDQVTAALEKGSQEGAHLTLQLAQVEDQTRGVTQENTEKEESIRVKQRTLELLPDAENNLLKLQGVIESSAQRIVNLVNQWEVHRLPLIEEQRRLRELLEDRELESSRKLEEIQATQEKMKDLAEDLKGKEAVYKQLLKEYNNLPKEVTRSAYTHRILEIVGNIKKQKEEITKILLDTKAMQKDINNLTGKLERTFAVTDELVFKDAKRDEAVRKAYKYLAALHENCSHLIQTIEDTGTIMREVRDLEEQIESEMGKMMVTNLEKILGDHKAIQQDNSVLLMKLKET